jgi:hypothetical protein
MRSKSRRTAYAALLFSATVVGLASYAWSGDRNGPGKTAPVQPAAREGKVKLYGIWWHKSVDSAVRAAADARPAKPIFVLRTLGDLSGLT